MKIISCASYYGSGSSAITDLLSEYSVIYSFTDSEFRFLHDPNGISDLEYNLVENFNRHNSGRALKQYKKMVDFNAGNRFLHRYEKFFKGNWKKYSYKYIDDLTDFKYYGSWQYDELDKGMLFYYFVAVINRILHKTIWRNKKERFFNPLKNEITYCSHPSEEKFLRCTRRYIYDLFSSISNGYSNVMVDQVVPSTNIARYLRYFNNIKVFIVDRDPRDIFLLEKYVWKDGMLPTDVQTFCKWYLYTRANREKELIDTNHVMYIQFEDLIYNYDVTVKKIENWLGLDANKHGNIKKFFDPELSIKNVHLWNKYPNSLSEIEFIEKKLNKYLYK